MKKFYDLIKKSTAFLTTVIALNSCGISEIDLETAVKIAVERAQIYTSKNCQQNVEFKTIHAFLENLEIKGEYQKYFDIELSAHVGSLLAGSTRIFVYQQGPMSRFSSGASEIVSYKVRCK